MPAAERDQREADIAGMWADLSPHLDERSRRLLLAAQARRLGHGGIKFVADAAGADTETIRAGIAELAAGPGGEAVPAGRVRRAGGGRKKATVTDPELPGVLDRLVDDDAAIAGNPMTPRLRWTSKSLAKLSEELTALGHKASPSVVRKLLLAGGWRLQSTNKSLGKGTRHPDRDGQFRYLSQLVAQFCEQGQPVISVDTKKKELVGKFAAGGQEYRRTGQPEQVYDHDFPSWAEGKAIPYGIYDLAANEGFVSVGDDHDTPAFAVAALEAWWTTAGKARYPDATKLLITADSGGSNGARSRAYKMHLAAFAAWHGLEVTVLHYPSGTSKWNRVEHRLFSFISINWRGKPLTSYETIIELISATTTKKGLTVTAARDTGTYPTGEKVSDKDMRDLRETRITGHDWHPDWNYTIHPAEKPETEVI